MSSPSESGSASAIATGPAEVRVRRATVADIDEVVRLRVALLCEHPDHPVYGHLHAEVNTRARELFASQLRSEGEIIFLGYLGEHIAGVLRCVEMIGSPLLEPSRFAYVSSTYVRPECRRMGVLRALVSAAELWSRERGLGQMRLHNVAGSESAEGAWSALGFAVVEQVRVRALDYP